MNAYRIAKKKYIGDLSGTGAKKHGGRWNQKGTSLLYASESISLAVLEILVHTQIDNLPADLKLFVLKFPDSASKLKLYVDDLPDNWRDYPAPNKLAEIGTNWINKAERLILQVPSVVIPEERNLLINPNHPEFKKIKIEEVIDFKFDDRVSE